MQEAQNSKVAEYALAGAKLVGKAAANTALFTAKEGTKFAWNNPTLAAGLVVGGYVYYKRNDIKDWCNEKIEQTKQLVDKVAPVALTAAAGKILYDLLPGSKPQVLNKPIAVEDMEDWLKEYEKFEGKEQSETDIRTQDVQLPKTESAAMPSAQASENGNNWVTEFKSQEIVQQEQEKRTAIERAQSRIAVNEFAKMDKAWKQGEAESKAQSSAGIEAKEARIAQSPAQREESQQLAAEFSQRFDGQEPIKPIAPKIHLIDPRIMINHEQENEQHPWVAEFKKSEAEQPVDKWVKQYKKEQSLNRAYTFARQLIESAEIDEPVESMEDNRALNGFNEMNHVPKMVDNLVLKRSY